MEILSVKGVDDPEALALVDRYATDQDRAYASDRRLELKRRQSLLGRALIRHLAEKLDRIPSYDWSFSPQPNGRWQILGPQGSHGPSFSISHSGIWVACAVSRAPSIGLDIEAIDKPRPFRSIAAQYFSKEELAVIENEGLNAFYDIWTLREAVAKATGGGLPAALSLDGRIFPSLRRRHASPLLCGIRWRTIHSQTKHYSLACAYTLGGGAVS